MERITKQNYKFNMLNIIQGMTKYTEIDEIMNCLAAYEDTGLTPEEITKLCTQCNAAAALHKDCANELDRICKERDTLEKALKSACNDLERGAGCEPAEDDYHAMKDYEHFIQQAQNREGKK